jgi:DNA primase large subunit
MDALENSAIPDRSLTNDAECLLELFSYPNARILASCIADDFLIIRYALAEAKKARDRLANEDMGFVFDVCAQLGLDVHNGKEIRVYFSDFLRNSAQMRAKEWKLVNQKLVKGYVHISKSQLLRLIQQAIQLKIESELPLEVNDRILSRLEKYTEDIREVLVERKKEYQAEDFGQISITRLPPCMRKFISMLQAGENLSHSARFALTAFLRTLGMGTEEILRLFASAPDFDEKKARYQVEHITGRISGKQYTPPECSTMKSYNICFDPDDLCGRDWMNHPLTYYRVKSKSAKGRNGKSKLDKTKKGESESDGIASKDAETGNLTD